MKYVSPLSAILLAATLSGCTAIQALTFQPHEHSGVAAGKIELTLLGDQLPELSPEQKKQPEAVAAQDILITKLNWCSQGRPVKNGALGAVLLPAFASLAINLVGDELASYVDKQQAKFTKSFSIAKNQNFLFSHATGTSAFELPFSCVVVTESSKTGGGSSEGLEFAARIEPIEQDGLSSDYQPYKLVPVYYRLGSSAAETGDKGAVDVKVEIAISAIQTGGGGGGSQHGSDAGQGNDVPAPGEQHGGHNNKPAVTEKPDDSGLKAAPQGSGKALADITVALSGISLPAKNRTAEPHCAGSEVQSIPGCVRSPDDPLGVNNETPWFVLHSSDDEQACIGKGEGCERIMPYTITATVTEVGTGSPDYGLAKTEVTDTTKALSDTVSKAIAAAYPSKSKK